MRKIVLLSLVFYQKILSPLLHRTLGVSHACRYLPTCSEYAKIHIAHEGVLIGGAKALARLLYCQPFTKQLPKGLQN